MWPRQPGQPYAHWACGHSAGHAGSRCSQRHFCRDRAWFSPVHLPLPPSVLEFEVLGLYHYEVQPTPVFWHGACGQEWTAGRLQLPLPGHLCGTMGLGGKESQHLGKVISAVGPPSGGRASTCPRWRLLSPSPLSRGPFPQPCPARVSCPLRSVLSQRREELALVSTADVEEGAAIAYSMAGNDTEPALPNSEPQSWQRNKPEMPSHSRR